MPLPSETLAQLRQLLTGDLARARKLLGSLEGCHLQLSFSNHYWAFEGGQQSSDWTIAEWVEFVSEAGHDALFARFYTHLLAESWLAGKSFREMRYKRLEDALRGAEPFAFEACAVPPESRRERAWARVVDRLSEHGYSPLFAWRWDLSGQGEGMQLCTLAVRPVDGISRPLADPSG